MELYNLIEEEKKFRTKLGNELKAVRESKGYSLTYLAEQVSIKPTTLEKIEAGRFSISVDYLVRFSIILEHEFVISPRVTGNKEE